MQDLKLGKFRRARVWINELPEAVFDADHIITHSLKAMPAKHSVKCVAVEVLKPVGARTIYGLLGAEFKSNTSNNLTIEISVSAQQERLFTQTILGSYDAVHIGLLQEYADTIVDTIELNKESLLVLGSGVLSIHCAAHAGAGSSPLIFKQLVMILIQLMGLADPKANELESIFSNI